jgi:hypothetical protein
LSYIGVLQNTFNFFKEEGQSALSLVEIQENIEIVELLKGFGLLNRMEESSRTENNTNEGKYRESSVFC